jgi:hypothetical protein
MHACSVESTLHWSFQLDYSLNFLPGLQRLDGASLDGPHVEQLQQALSRSSLTSFWS